MSSLSKEIMTAVLIAVINSLQEQGRHQFWHVHAAALFSVQPFYHIPRLRVF